MILKEFYCVAYQIVMVFVWKQTKWPSEAEEKIMVKEKERATPSNDYEEGING